MTIGGNYAMQARREQRISTIVGWHFHAFTPFVECFVFLLATILHYCASSCFSTVVFCPYIQVVGQREAVEASLSKESTWKLENVQSHPESPTRQLLLGITFSCGEDTTPEAAGELSNFTPLSLTSTATQLPSSKSWQKDTLSTVQQLSH